MKILLIKTSSMGDIIHTLPAVSDASKLVANLDFTWVVEENFREIPAWHPHVSTVMPIAWRRWRQHLLKASTRTEIKHFLHNINKKSYDVIIDGQGLIKSAIFAMCATGPRHGFDAKSSREPLATMFYHKSYYVPAQQHAILRLRRLFSKILAYPLPTTAPEYGLKHFNGVSKQRSAKYLMFCHGTTWHSKMWSQAAWLKLAKLAANSGFIIKLLWYNKQELANVTYLATQCPTITIMPPQNLTEVAILIANARAVVALDTGFTHLATALNVPSVALYGPTNPQLSGSYGPKQICLNSNFACAPCFLKKCKYHKTFNNSPCLTTLAPEKVWDILQTLMV